MTIRNASEIDLHCSGKTLPATGIIAGCLLPEAVPIFKRLISSGPAIVACGSLCGCLAGPDYHPPTLPLTSGYGPQALQEPHGSTNSKTAEGGSTRQHFVLGQTVSGRWWTAFGSPVLNQLVEEALAHNPTLEVAQATLAASNEDVLAQAGTLLPSVTANLLGSQQRAPNGGLQSPLSDQQRYTYGLLTPRVSIEYAPDIFGGNRRRIEELEADASARRFELEAATLTIATNVVRAAIEEAALRAEIEATDKVIAAQQNVLTLYRKELALGELSQSEIGQQEVALAASQLLLPSLKKALLRQRNLLTALTGRLPSDALEESFTLRSLHLPTRLPVALPSQLVLQRPDIRAADDLVHAAAAAVGVAVANRLPQFTITSSDGASGISLARLAANGGFYSIAGTVAQPLFDAGTLYHRQRAAQDRLDAAEARQKELVLAAFQNVADVLQALQIDGGAVSAAAQAEQAATTNFSRINKERAVGAANALQVLLAQQAYLSALVTAAQTRGSVRGHRSLVPGARWRLGQAR